MNVRTAAITGIALLAATALLRADLLLVEHSVAGCTVEKSGPIAVRDTRNGYYLVRTVD